MPIQSRVSIEADYAELVGRFMNAPLEKDGWERALVALADRTGSQFAQMIGLGDDTTTFNRITQLSADELETYSREFIDGGFHRPEANWRIAASAFQSDGLVTERDYDAFRADPRFADYEEHIHRWGGTHGCQAILAGGGSDLIGLAVLRSEREGRMDERGLALVDRILPVIRGAVRMQVSLGQHEADLLGVNLAAIGATALLCDRAGSVRAMTPAAERELAAGRYLTLREGRPRPRWQGAATAFDHALGAVLRGEGGDRRLWLKDDADPHAGCICDISALPVREFDLGFAPRALIVLRLPKSLAGSPAALFAAAYALSPAEAAVALLLAEGLPRATIAEQRGASLQTVTSQLRTIFRKCDVTREGELIALVNRLLR